MGTVTLALAGSAESPPHEEGADGIKDVRVERVYSPGEWQAIAFALADSMSVPRRRDMAALPEARVETNRGAGYGWRDLVSRYDWPVDEALRVIQCESSGNPNAENNGNYGLFQINWGSHWGKLKRVTTGSTDYRLLFDPVVNTEIAYLVYVESGGRTWLPWSCRP